MVIHITTTVLLAPATDLLLRINPHQAHALRKALAGCNDKSLIAHVYDLALPLEQNDRSEPQTSCSTPNPCHRIVKL